MYLNNTNVLRLLLSEGRGIQFRNTTYKIKDFLPQGKHWNDHRLLQQQQWFILKKFERVIIISN